MQTRYLFRQPSKISSTTIPAGVCSALLAAILVIFSSVSWCESSDRLNPSTPDTDSLTLEVKPMTSEQIVERVKHLDRTFFRDPRVIGEDAGPALAAMMSDANPKVRELALQCLNIVGGVPARQSILKGLRDSDLYVCLAANALIEYHATQDDLPELLKILKSHASLRETIPRIIGRMGVPQAIPPLKAQLKKESNSDVAAALRLALIRLKDPAFQKSFIGRLHSNDPFERSQALKDWLYIQNPCFFSDVLLLMKDQRDGFNVAPAGHQCYIRVCDTAIWVLDEICNHPFPFEVNWLKRYSPSELEAAMDTLEHFRFSDSTSAENLPAFPLTPQTIVERIQKFDWSVCETPGALGPESASALTTLMHSPDRKIRQLALTCLIQTGGVTARQSLLDALQDSDLCVRGIAAHFFADHVQADDWPTLKVVLTTGSDSFVLNQVALAAGHVEHPEVVSTLKTTLEKSKQSLAAEGITLALTRLKERDFLKSYTAKLGGSVDSYDRESVLALSQLPYVNDATLFPKASLALLNHNYVQNVPPAGLLANMRVCDVAVWVFDEIYNHPFSFKVERTKHYNQTELRMAIEVVKSLQGEAAMSWQQNRKTFEAHLNHVQIGWTEKQLFNYAGEPTQKNANKVNAAIDWFYEWDEGLDGLYSYYVFSLKNGSVIIIKKGGGCKTVS